MSCHLDLGWGNVSDQGSGGTIDHHLAQVVEQLAGSVLTGLEVKQLRILINKPAVNNQQ